ncbi:MAG TPA: DUF6089 family protein [Paludibacter sp.]|nr:DUF6089 family protein [Paludibacter sp.]
MKKILLSIFLVMLTFSALQAQRRNGLIGHRIESTGELVFAIGPSYSFADPDCSKGIFGPIINQNMFDNQHVSLGYRTTFNDDFGYKIALGYDHFTGNDIKTPRNYSFETNAFQFAGQAEYYYHFGRRFRRRWPNTVYGFLGVGIITSNTVLNSPVRYTYYKYRDSDITPVIPYGAGYKYDIDNQFSVGAEIYWRYTFSDFLDGFKPKPPASKSNDVLEGFLLTVSYKL